MTTFNAKQFDAANTISNVEEVSISKKVGNKREPVGTVGVPVPTLADLGIEYPAGDLVGQWVDKCLRAAALTDARNKLKPGTVDLKPGAKLATSLEELARPSENTGEALKEIAAVKRAFAAFIDSQGLSERAAALLTGMFGSPKAAAMQSAPVLEKFTARVEAFVEAYGEDKLTGTQADYIGKLLDSAEDTEELDLDDL